MGVWGRYGSPNKTTMKSKRNSIWDCIDTTKIKGDKPLTNKSIKGFSIKKKKNKKPRKERKYARVPKKYNVYIKSKWWKKRRNKYFQDFGKKCLICGSSKYVVLHHLEYNHTVFGNEPDTMLVQLCNPHHEEFHAIYGVKHKMYADFDEFIEMKQSETILGWI